jgi:uncharacterized protein YbbC (DUF1343 family)
VAFVPIRFTPESSKFAGKDCGGVNVLITDRAALEPVRLGLEIAYQLRRLHAAEWDAAPYARLLKNAAVHEALLAGQTPDAMEAAYQAELEQFRQRRERFLLYR